MKGGPRGEDGVIVVSDMTTGLRTFRMDGFQGWNCKSWACPTSRRPEVDKPVKPRPVSD